MRIEQLIIHHVMHNKTYASKVMPFIKPEYFQDSCERLLFSNIYSFMQKYSAMPSTEALSVEIENQKGLTEEEHKRSQELVDNIKRTPEDTPIDWLIDSAEKFCQDKSIYNAIMSSISILDGKSKFTKEHLPELLKEALSVSFDSRIGHDFLEDFDDRYTLHHKLEERIPFDLDYMNKITRGGLPRKTLNIILGGTGVGKTLVMCHMAAANLMLGKNVLYITLEMSEYKIAERIDANLLNVMLDELETLPRNIYESKLDKVRIKTKGRLIIKEYPTASAHSGHFRHLIDELNLKKDFVPDIIYIDYINICASSRVKQGSNINSYSYIKFIAEEFRGLAVEKNVPLVSATQTTRSGYSNSDPNLEDTSESFGLPATADFMIALVSNEELQTLNQIMVKQLKNRYADTSISRRFVVGVDRSRMKLYDVEETSQDLQSDTPIMDNTPFGKRAKEDDQMKWSTKTKGRKDFSGLKV